MQLRGSRILLPLNSNTKKIKRFLRHAKIAILMKQDYLSVYFLICAVQVNNYQKRIVMINKLN